MTQVFMDGSDFYIQRKKRRVLQTEGITPDMFRDHVSFLVPAALNTRNTRKGVSWRREDKELGGKKKNPQKIPPKNKDSGVTS